MVQTQTQHRAWDCCVPRPDRSVQAALVRRAAGSSHRRVGGHVRRTSETPSALGAAQGAESTTASAPRCCLVLSPRRSTSDAERALVRRALRRLAQLPRHVARRTHGGRDVCTALPPRSADDAGRAPPEALHTPFRGGTSNGTRPGSLAGSGPRPLPALFGSFIHDEVGREEGFQFGQPSFQFCHSGVPRSRD